MPDMPSVTSIKRFTYRGVPEEWSNTYHFSGTTPANAAAWKTLTDAIAAAEKLCLFPSTNIVRFYGYEAGNDNSVYQRDMTLAPDAVVPGTLDASGQIMAPGDTAGTLRWQTPDFTSRGKRIYGRKFWHGVGISTGTLADNLATSQRLALEVLGAKLIDGTLPGSFKACGPQGAVFSNPVAGVYVTTRTLKRRGKRPPTT